jgi:hypothetical protein
MRRGITLFRSVFLCLVVASFLGLAAQNALAERPEIGTVIDHTNWEKYKEYLGTAVQGLMQKNYISYRVVARHSHVSMPIEEWTEKGKGQASVGPDDELLNYSGRGIPFPEIDLKDPKAGEKVYWNQDKRYCGDTAFYSPATVYLIDSKGHEKSFKAEMLQYKTTERYVMPPMPEVPGTKVRAYMRINTIEPYDMKGFAVVMHIGRPELNVADEQWAYIPMLRRVRRMSTSLKGDAFAGSDETYADSYPGAVNEFSCRILDFKEMLVCYYCNEGCAEEILTKRQGFKIYNIPVEFTPIYVVEAAPKDKNYHYSKYVYYLDPEYWQVNMKECYDQKGELWKLHTFYGCMAFGAAGANLTSMMDLQSEHMTLGDSVHCKFNVDIPVKEFEPERLKEIGK